jgi:hypothetical protein
MRVTVMVSGTGVAVLNRLQASERFAGAAVISGMAVVSRVEEAKPRHAKESKEADQKE